MNALPRSFARLDWLQALLLGSCVATAIAYAFLFDLFHRFDVDQAVVKFLCFEALLVLLLVSALGNRRRLPGLPEPGRVESLPIASWVLWLELALASAVLLWEIYRGYGRFTQGLDVAMNDIGGTTEEAIRDLLGPEHIHPYKRKLAIYGPDRRFWGYKYGPGMLVAYAASALWPGGVGIKISNLVFLIASAVLVAYLAVPRASEDATALSRAAAAAFACALFLLPERLYFELFTQGVIDIYPTLLLLAALALADRGRWLTAGFALGLSFATKISPAVFMIACFVHRPIRLRFWVGVALGLFPFLPFTLWHWNALVRNVVIFHSQKSWDSTSLYYLTPPELHWMFSAAQLAALLGAIGWSLSRPFSREGTVTRFTVLLVMVAVSYREMHGNHLIWFMPFFALVFTWQRHGFAGFLPAWVLRAEPASTDRLQNGTVTNGGAAPPMQGDAA